MQRILTLVLCVSVVLGVLLGVGVAPARGQELDMKGSSSFSILMPDPNIIIMRVQEIANERTESTDPLALELWATDTAYAGGDLGDPNDYLLGSSPLGVLPAETSWNKITVTSRFTPPPNGVYHISLVLIEDNTIQDYLPFDMVSFGGSGSGGGELEFFGDHSFSMAVAEDPNDSTVTFELDGIRNNQETASETLYIELWAVDAPYTGGPHLGDTTYQLAQEELGALDGESSWLDLAITTGYNPPPNGEHYLVMLLLEAQDTSYVIKDYRATEMPVSFSSGNNNTEGLVQMLGSINWWINPEFSEGNAVMEVDRIENGSSTAAGPLTLELWATESLYVEGALDGYQVCSADLGTIPGGENLFLSGNDRIATPFTLPPDGTYYIAMVLKEDGLIKDVIAFESPITFDTGGGGGGGGADPNQVDGLAMTLRAFKNPYLEGYDFFILMGSELDITEETFLASETFTLTLKTLETDEVVYSTECARADGFFHDRPLDYPGMYLYRKGSLLVRFDLWMGQYLILAQRVTLDNLEQSSQLGFWLEIGDYTGYAETQ